MTTETRTVTLTIGRDTREVEVFRYSERHGWQTVEPVIGMRPTGTVRHPIQANVVERRDGTFRFASQQLILNRNTGRVVAWE